MYPPSFEYHRADSVDHALELIADHPEAEILAGGHSLLPTMKTGLASPDALIDLGGVDELRGVEHGGDALRVGALTTYAAVARSEAVRDDARVVAETAGEIGDVQVRNRGTVGGNVAHADPASDLPAAVVAADATIRARGPDSERTIDADDFFVGMYATALDDDELLTAIDVPQYRADVGGAYAKKASPSSGYALVGVAALVRVDDGVVESARVAANGVVDHAIRLGPVEEALAGEPVGTDAIAAAAERADDDLEAFAMMDDIQASSEFRAQLLRVYTERALSSAAERATAGRATV